MAIAVDRQYSKDDILIYINPVYFGEGAFWYR